MDPSTTVMWGDSMFPEAVMRALDEYFWIILAIIVIGSVIATVRTKRRRPYPF